MGHRSSHKFAEALLAFVLFGLVLLTRKGKERSPHKNMRRKYTKDELRDKK